MGKIPEDAEHIHGDRSGEKYPSTERSSLEGSRSIFTINGCLG